MSSSRRTFKKFLYNGFCLAGGRLFARTFFSGVGTILLFHRVCPAAKGERIAACAGLEVTPQYLEDVISFFSERDYDFISPDEMVVRLRENRFDKKFVVITFDDGYLDNLTYAYPIFKKHNVPFAIYITTGFIDKTSVMLWYALENLLLIRERVRFEFDGRIFDFQCADSLEKERVFWELFSLITSEDETGYLDIIKQIFSGCLIDIYGKADDLALSWDQIRRLYADSLATMGAHTINHYPLNRVSFEALEREISESKKRIVSQVGGEIRHFSYPHGNKGEAEKREFRVVKESGFVTAVTTRMGNIFPAHKKYLECLPRISMSMELDRERLQMVIDGVMPLARNRFQRVLTY